MKNNTLFKENIYPYLLVVLQLGSLVFLLTSAPVIPESMSAMLLESAGFFLGILAIFQNGIGNFNIAPTLRPGAVLVTHGIYRIIRHPMYLAQLLMLLPLVSVYFGWIRLAVWLLLLAVLLLKIAFEEKRLLAHFEGYRDYASRTWKMIPFIF